MLVYNSAEYSYVQKSRIINKIVHSLSVSADSIINSFLNLPVWANFNGLTDLSGSSTSTNFKQTSYIGLTSSVGPWPSESRSLNLVSQLGLSTWSLNLVPHLGPSSWSLVLVLEVPGIVHHVLDLGHGHGVHLVEASSCDQQSLSSE